MGEGARPSLSKALMLSTLCTAAPCPDVQTPPLLGDPLCPPQPPTAPVGASAVPLLTPLSADQLCPPFALVVF